MTIRYVGALAALLVLAGCDTGGNPLQDPEEETPVDGEEPGDVGEPIDSDRVLPPGTASPEPRSGIFRQEPAGLEEDGEEYGNGFANSFAYDSGTDTFFVEGLAFDGSQPEGVPFNRATPGTLATNFALYEMPDQVEDFFTGTPINQFVHRALYGVSGSGETEFAIVRTGAYLEYGFGGFVYQRNGGTVLPVEGQATYSGDYAGLRDFNGRGGLEYVEGDMRIDIDYAAFTNNCTPAPVCENAVFGRVTNRVIYDTAGNDITADVVAAIDADEDDVTILDLPVLQFRIGPNVMDANGEIVGQAFSSLPSGTYEDGNYYALMSGDHNTGGEIVGVIVVEAEDPRYDQVTVRETGGFIANRN